MQDYLINNINKSINITHSKCNYIESTLVAAIDRIEELEGGLNDH